MESPTIRKVRACFGEAEKQLFSSIQECLTSFPSVIEVITVKASYYFVNGLTSNIFTVYTSQIIAQFFSLFYLKLSQCILVAVRFLEAIFNEGVYTWVLKIVTDSQTNSLTNLIKCVVVCRSYSYAFWST